MGKEDLQRGGKDTHITALPDIITTSSDHRLETDSVSAQRIVAVKRALQFVTDENIEALGVFGSVASGEASEESDLDYFLIKQRGLSGLQYSIADAELYRQINQLPFHCQITGALSLEEMHARGVNKTKTTLVQFFGTPADLQKFGIKPLDPQQVFIRNLVLVGRSPEQEQKLVQRLLTGKEKAFRSLARSRR